MKQYINFSKLLLIISSFLYSVNCLGVTETLSCTAGTIVNNTMTFQTTNFTIVHAKAADANFASFTPWRVYANNTVTISAGSNVKSITSLVIYTTSTAYASAVNGLIQVTGGGSASATVSGNNCTITISGTATSIVIDPTAQTRWSSIDINYTSVTSCVPSTAAFELSSVTKQTGNANFTNLFISNNTSSKVWASSNSAVATVNSSGEVAIVGVGTTTISVSQVADGTYCEVLPTGYLLTVLSGYASEPTNDATGLIASTNTDSEVTLFWTDATGVNLPQGYIVKASLSMNVAPVDGVAESNSTLVKNIVSGTQSCVFSGLTSSSLYHFSIWPYTGIGSDVNYKTGGVAPVDSARTVTLIEVPVATSATDVTHFSSANSFVSNWQPVNNATGYLLSVTKAIQDGAIQESENFSGITPNGNLIATANYTAGWSAVSQSSSRQIYTTTGNFGAASPSFAFTTTGDYIQTRLYSSAISSVSLWVKAQTGTTSSTLIEGYNGVSWETIATLSNADATTAGTKTFNLIALGKTNIRQIKLTFTKVAGNLSVDDIVINYLGGTSYQPIVGSPFEISGGEVSSFLISGLVPSIYYYTVSATNGVFTTAGSNEIEVIVDVTTPIIASNQLLVQVFGVKGGIRVVGTGNFVIHDTLGQTIKLVHSSIGNSIITLPKGIYFVQTDHEIKKIVVK